MALPLTAHNLPHITAVIDAQGFQIGNNFYVREISVVADHFVGYLELDAELGDEWANSPNIRYQTNFVHGIPLSPSALAEKASDLSGIIKAFYAVAAFKAGDLVAIKNRPLGNILDEMGLGFVDLDHKHSTIICPATDTLVMENPSHEFCPIHTAHADSKLRMRCARKKAYHIWDWIVDEKQIYSDDNELDLPEWNGSPM
ncbi:hypothetical protein HDE_09786 [Halotydeus destructor]|nr:hypothetical protein HDE_09786 [Halotydeus destructor]